MIQEIAPKKFDNAYHAKSPKPDDFVLVFRGHGKPDDRILCRIEDGKIILPTYSELVLICWFNGIKYPFCNLLFFSICTINMEYPKLYRCFHQYDDNFELSLSYNNLKESSEFSRL